MTGKRKMPASALLLWLAVVVAWPGFGGGAASAATARLPADLGVLFIGAHPDDEAGNLSTFGHGTSTKASARASLR